MSMKTNIQRCRDIIRLATSYWIPMEKLRTHTLVSRRSLDKIIEWDKTIKQSTTERFIDRWLVYINDLKLKTEKILK
jgi:hypothetical protein